VSFDFMLQTFVFQRFATAVDRYFSLDSQGELL